MCKCDLGTIQIVYVANVLPGLHVWPLTSEQGLSLSLFPVTECPSPYLNCLVGPQCGRMCLVLLGLDVSEWGLSKEFSPSCEKEGQLGERLVRVGLGRE